MSPEELDEARAKEADRLWGEAESRVGELSALQVAARLARENWTPPEPVDPDVLAFREWSDGHFRLGDFDQSLMTRAFLAGARMAREQERERAKVLVEYVREAGNSGLSKSGEYARAVLCKYARAGDD